jgi:S-DNA-T family DNA segregation ATPase FtsK/SpoIIIE
MQPMMVISSGEPFPETALVVLLHAAWRYRSELAPLACTAVIICAASWLHAAHPHWWPFSAILSAIAAPALVAFGKKILPALLERIYAATAILTAGGWISAATAIGPFRSPLPQVLLYGAFILSVPWWAHRRRRAKVRIERKLQAWPEIASAIGLAGSQVMSAAVDVWGWRARFRLARGQTISDVVAKIPAIESGLGTFRGAVRVYPTPDDLANRCELRVLDSDPHADAIHWPGSPVTSITQPIDLGPFEDATPCLISFLRRHGIFGGTTGSGKSGGINVLIANLSACADAVIWAVDLKNGMELKPWQACIGRLATTPEEACALLRDAVAIVQARAGYLAATGRRVWEPSPDVPALVIIIDEYAELADDAPDAMQHTDSIARLGRAVAVTIVAATQRPTQKAMGQGAVRSQMDLRISFRVREPRDVDLILGQGMLNAGWQAHKLNAPGKFLVSAPEHDIPKRARTYLITDEAVQAISAQHADTRPELDEISRHAIAIPGSTDGLRESMPQDRNGKSGADQPAPDQPPNATESLLLALCIAPDEGWATSELMKMTGIAHTTLYRHLGQLAREGRAVQVSRGHWRARTTEEPWP